MMKLKDYSIFIFLLFGMSFYAQNTVSGKVTFAKTNKPIADVFVYDKAYGFLTKTNGQGVFSFKTSKPQITIVFYAPNYQIKEQTVNSENATNLKIELNDLTAELSEVVINSNKKKAFNLRRLNDVEETAIYAGKKTEVILVEQSMANLASNNARQIYNQVAGLNIFQNDDAGLQLNIGGRGLDPNRTSNFNTRQNGYDISADVLGYPESYYTPATEGVEEIQVIRGAASLQYGTQFGGLINFKMKSPNPKKPIEIITRNTLGSYGLFTNFTSLSGTTKKLSYYTYANYKTGDGFRPNSQFKAINIFTHLGYQFNDKSSLKADVTYLDYLAQQAGGLNDAMFENSPFQSNRERNWFEVNWLLYNLKFQYKFSEKTNFTFNFFGLNASRNAIGFRDRRVDMADDGKERELLIGNFNNFGFETRLLNKYNLFNKKATFLIGAKYYNADNSESQGPGSNGNDANFSSTINQYPNYKTQGDFTNPNKNIAVFGENILYMTDKLSITPGFRFEYIKTGSNGISRRTNFDAAGNPIGNEDKTTDLNKERAFVLLGVGSSYKPNKTIELYSNLSQNYRSITFSDVNIVNPSNAVDPNLNDENGFTIDFGVRGNYNNFMSYDISAFGLFYNNRIGFLNTRIPPVNYAGQLRTNIGDARIVGLESLLDFNLNNLFKLLPKEYSFNYFINASTITSKYTSAITTGIEGNKVEFVPDLNIKTGLRFAYKNFNSSIQYTYMSEQFTDASNSSKPDNLNSIIGLIPAYNILDLSLSYKYRRFKIETGINNLMDTIYFTRRATGYPGPGIIPSAPRNWYTTLQLKL